MPCARRILGVLVALLMGWAGGAVCAADSVGVSVTLTIGTPVAPAVTVVPSTSAGAPLLVSESGGVAVAVVSLNQAPDAAVTIAVTNPSPDEVTVSTTALTFTPADWSPRVVVVTGVDDAITDGAQAVAIALGPASGGIFTGVTVPTLHVRNLDDEVPALVLAHSDASTTVGESGLGDTMTVVLAAQPAGAVTVSLAIDPQVSLAPSALTFDASDWNLPRTVTLTAIDDVLPNGTRTHLLGASAAGGGYSGASALLPVTVLDDDAAALQATPASITTSEGGGTAQIQVRLSSRPQSDVVLDASSQAPDEAGIVPAAITISPDNWQTPAVFTVTGVDDALGDGNQAFAIVVAASGDSAFAGQSATVSGVNLDDDSKGVLIGSVSTLALVEGGTAATYRVRLAQPPTAPVTVAIAGDAAVGSGPASLTFTTANWSAWQTVTATAVDDDIAQGRHSGTLSHTWTSADPGYNAVTALSLTFSIADNDSASIAAVVAGAAVTTEIGGTATIGVRLGSRPTGTVTVPVVSSDTTQGTVSPSSLVFDATTWNTVQTVTVTGADGNARDDGDVPYGITFGPAASADTAYAGLIGGPVTLTNRAVDHPPTLDPLVDRVVAEDSGQLLIALSGIGVGQAGEAQTVSLSVVSSAPAISGVPGIAYAAPLSTGTLALLPPADATGSAVITVTASDGVQSVARSFTLTVTPVNDPPTIVRSTQLVVAWHASAYLSPLQASGSAPGQLVGSDVETASAALEWLVVVAPNLGRLERIDALSGAATTLIAGDAFTQGEVTAGAIRYVHTSNAPALNDALQIQLRDADGGATAGALSIRIDASLPAVELLPVALATWTEGDAALPVAPLATITDLDSPSFAGGSLTVAVVGGDGNDRLAIIPEGDAAGQVGFDAGTGQVAYGGAVIGLASGGGGAPLLITWSNAGATPAVVQAVLRRVAFDVVGDDPLAGARSVTAQLVDDLGNTGPVARRSLAVVAVNDPPVVPAVSLVAVAGQRISSACAASDPDSATLTWSLVGPAGRGTATIDAATGVLAYQAAADASGTDTFAIAVSDGALTTTATVTVRITGPASSDRLWVVSDPPLEIQEDAVLTFNLVVDDAGIIGGASDLRFQLLEAPAGMAIAPDPLNRQAAVTWTAVAGTEPHVRIRILAWDETSGAADVLQAVIYVHAAPGAPN